MIRNKKKPNNSDRARKAATGVMAIMGEGTYEATSV